ncbi:hypothetical protein K466DRAFT_388314 [Polyporus arcularius HHB13444]|uniref:Uncharacterized protein n=1 Tax=Polyporus arcularius HHB13444 TaxID=1314778 RepID=A0A5C3PM56_9APHY|nr:hypothetical protein K466DRAFT_388314 [Polyporus arcularius HHB13444]
MSSPRRDETRPPRAAAPDRYIYRPRAIMAASAFLEPVVRAAFLIMFGDVQRMPPQLPPLPPQPSLATPSNWKLHYPPEDISLPPSSWSAPTPSHPVRRSKSTNTSPPRRLPESSDQVAGDSANRAGPSAVPFPPTSKPRSHSHSRSHSRVPLPVVPSASSSELMIISPPIRTHSRNISTGVVKPPTARPSSADKDKEKDASRVPPRVSKQLPPPPPPPLPLVDRVPTRDQSLTAGVLRPTTSTPSPALSTPASPHVILSAPPRPTIKRYISSPHVKALAEIPPPIPFPSPSPSSIHTERRPVLIALNPDEPFLHMDAESPPPSRAPVRAPTPPRPRAASSTTRPPQPSQPSPLSRAHNTPSSWKPQDSMSGRAVMAPAPIRGRGVEVAVSLRTSPGTDARTVTVTPAPPPKAQKTSEPPTRKWVLERKGKRLTQDSMVVAQQLRMLR